MDRKLINPAIVQDIAAAIREKGGQTEPIVVNALGDAIRALPQGMGDNTTEVVEAISGEQPEGDIEIANAIAKGATDAAREHVWQGERATDEGRELRDGVAFVSALRGQSIKMVQEIDKSIYAIDSLFNGISFNLYGESGLVVCNGTSTGRANHRVNKYNIPYANGHKLFVVGCPKNGTSATYHLVCVEYKNGVYQATMGYEYGDGAILTAKSSETNEIVIEVVAANASGQSVDNLTFLPQVFDFTAMFGAGNEPTTPDDFAHRLGYADAASLPYIPYGEQIINSKPTEVVSRGTRYEGNIYNYETDTIEAAYITTTPTWQPASDSASVRLRCQPNTTYRIKFNTETTPTLVKCACAHSYIVPNGSSVYKREQFVAGDFEYYYTTDSEAQYIILQINQSWFNANKANVVVGSPVTKPSRLPLPLSTILHEGQPLFPNGLCGIGDVKDEVDWAKGKAVKRIGVVDLGNYIWIKQTVTEGSPIDRYACTTIQDKAFGDTNLVCNRFTLDVNVFARPTSAIPNAICGRPSSNYIYVSTEIGAYATSAAFKTAMSGVMLYYELATPIEVTFDPAKAFYKVQNGGSEEAVMDGLSAPLVADIAYRDNMAYSEEAALLAFANERSGQNDADLGDAIRTLSE